jgi:hypothetical protein
MTTTEITARAAAYEAARVAAIAHIGHGTAYEAARSYEAARVYLTARTAADAAYHAALQAVA